MALRLLSLLLTLLLLSAAHATTDPLETQARRFVMLATALGHVRPAEIDAYWGPPELDMRARGKPPTLAQLGRDVAGLRADVARDAPSSRQQRLLARLGHLAALLHVLQKPRALSFDQEARQVYGLVIPPPDLRRQARTLAALDRMLPGRGDLSARLAAWRTRFVIPDYRRRAVFLRALEECRARTLAHLPLPPDEKVDVVWGAQVPAAWHRYQGRHRSRLEINPAAVADPGTALDVACHEGYPGHHVQFVAMDDGHPPVEDTVVILRSPEMALREGAANYGVELAFPPAQRLAFMRDVLFPMAGFDPRQAAAFEKVHRAVTGLSLSVMPILKDFYDGRLASGDAMAHLVLDAQIESPAALMDFTKDMGAYVAGYTAVRDMVGACVAAGGPDRWKALNAMMTRVDIGVLDSTRWPSPGHCL